jgi:hypothetical protein
MNREHINTINHINELVKKFNLILQEEYKIKTLSTDFKNEDQYLDFKNRNHFEYMYPKQVDKSGVYFILGFNSAEISKTCLYIGKASMNNSIGNRLDYYLKNSTTNSHNNILYHNKGNQFIEFLTVLPIDKENSFIAPALEEYLIKNWKEATCDLLNTIGNS